MPSGRTHDRITLWSLPVVAALTYTQTRSSKLTLLVAGGFLFSGLMFGPDLDIYSRQFQRWGWLRWIWIPYQKSLHHRSFLSHGPAIGTALRVLYLAFWIGAVAGVGVLVAQWVWDVEWSRQVAVEVGKRSLRQYWRECIAVGMGLELGAMSHSLSDWCGSAFKRFKAKGLTGLFAPAKKRSPTASQTKKSRGRSTRRTSRSQSSSNKRRS